MDRKILGVDRPTTGVYDNTRFCTIHATTQVEPNVERITSPNPVLYQVEVEDVDSDDKNDD